MEDIRHSILAGSKRFVHRVRIDLRNKGYSYQTEKTYIYWIKRFIRFHKNRHPETLVYLYRKFLQHELDALSFDRAHRKPAGTLAGAVLPPAYSRRATTWVLFNSCSVTATYAPQRYTPMCPTVALGVLSARWIVKRALHAVYGARIKKARIASLLGAL